MRREKNVQKKRMPRIIFFVQAVGYSYPKVFIRDGFGVSIMLRVSDRVRVVVTVTSKFRFDAKLTLKLRGGILVYMRLMIRVRVGSYTADFQNHSFESSFCLVSLVPYPSAWRCGLWRVRGELGFGRDRQGPLTGFIPPPSFQFYFVHPSFTVPNPPSAFGCVRIGDGRPVAHRLPRIPRAPDA